MGAPTYPYDWNDLEVVKAVSRFEGASEEEIIEKVEKGIPPWLILEGLEEMRMWKLSYFQISAILLICLSLNLLRISEHVC